LKKNGEYAIVTGMEIVQALEGIRKELDLVNKETEIIAATKTRTLDEIRVCMGTGLCLGAGENKVQELTEKYVPEFRWDFIGRLQTNKVKYLVGKVDLIHSVDRMELVREIDKQAQKHKLVQNILVEINGGNEENKGGIPLEEVDAFLDEIAKADGVCVQGLMSVAPLDASESRLKEIFSSVYEKFARYRSDTFRYLSMGMSNDYLIAAACGANIVRVGRAIFGERNYSV